MWRHILIKLTRVDARTQFHHDDLAEIRNILLDLQRRAIRQEAIMTNARIIKRNQHLRSTTPDAALTAPVKEVCSCVLFV